MTVHEAAPWATKTDDRLDVNLELPTVESMFTPPDLSPLSPSYRPYSYESGLEYIAYLLYADRRIKNVHAAFVLPSEELADTSHTDVEQAIGRWASAKIEASHIEVRADNTRGRRALLLGAIAMVILLLLAHWLFENSDPGYLRNTAITALQIGAWVSLWIPIDKLVWSAWTHRNDRVVYERLTAMTFTLEPQPDLLTIDDPTHQEHNHDPGDAT